MTSTTPAAKAAGAQEFMCFEAPLCDADQPASVQPDAAGSASGAAGDPNSSTATATQATAAHSTWRPDVPQNQPQRRRPRKRLLQQTSTTTSKAPPARGPTTLSGQGTDAAVAAPPTVLPVYTARTQLPPSPAAAAGGCSGMPSDSSDAAAAASNTPVADVAATQQAGRLQAASAAAYRVQSGPQAAGAAAQQLQVGSTNSRQAAGSLMAAEGGMTGKETVLGYRMLSQSASITTLATMPFAAVKFDRIDVLASLDATEVRCASSNVSLVHLACVPQQACCSNSQR